MSKVTMHETGSNEYIIELTEKHGSWFVNLDSGKLSLVGSKQNAKRYTLPEANECLAFGGCDPKKVAIIRF